MTSKEGDLGFYAGCKLVAVDALPGSIFINGQYYTCAAYEYRTNQVNGLKFWYVGIVGHGEWYRPSIFALVPDVFQPITFEKVIEAELSSVN